MKHKEHWPRALSVLLSLLLALNCLNASGIAYALEEAATNTDEAVTQQVDDAADLEAQATEQDVEASAEEAPALMLSSAADDGVQAASEPAPAVEEAADQDASEMQVLAEQDVITNIDATLNDGTAIGNNIITQWQVFRINADFELPDGQVHAGDTTTITLPDELRFNQTADFNITDGNGNVVATAKINQPSKTVTLTYTDYVENNSDIKGSFFFYVQMDRNVVTEATTVPLRFDVNGKTIIGPSVQFEGVPDPTPYKLNKSGWQLGEGANGDLQYELKINSEGISIQDAVVTDTLDAPGITILKDTLTIRKGRYEAEKGEWVLKDWQDVTSNYTVQWNDQSNSFTVNLGNVASNEGFSIRYAADSSYELVDGEYIRNKAVLTGNDTTLQNANNGVRYYIAGGTAEGYVYAIQVKKVDPEGNPLAGATFDVIRKANGETVGTITTDASGEARIGGLLKDVYQLKETSAPAGYTLLDEPIEVAVDQYNSEKVANVTVENKLDTTTFTVSKTWIGEALQSLVVRLFADGRQVDSVTLSAANNWTHTFDGLRKTNDDGTDIVYSAEEELADSNYSSDQRVDGSGVTFINTNNETISIPVTKTWVGIAAEQVTVHLTADGVEFDSATLTALNNWTHTFEDLRKFDAADGHEIVYDVTEDDIAGYSQQRTGSVAEGFTFTNTNDETLSIPVTKVWDDTDDKDGIRPDSITVHLTADVVEVDSVVLNAANNWTATFADLRVYDATDGHEIAYDVTEDDVTGYTSARTGSVGEGFTFTNTHVPEDPVKPSNPPKKSKQSKKRRTLPKMGDEAWGGVTALAAAGLACVGVSVAMRNAKKREQESA